MKSQLQSKIVELTESHQKNDKLEHDIKKLKEELRHASKHSETKVEIKTEKMDITKYTEYQELTRKLQKTE